MEVSAWFGRRGLETNDERGERIRTGAIGGRVERHRIVTNEKRMKVVDDTDANAVAMTVTKAMERTG